MKIIIKTFLSLAFFLLFFIFSPTDTHADYNNPGCSISRNNNTYTVTVYPMTSISPDFKRNLSTYLYYRTDYGSNAGNRLTYNIKSLYSGVPNSPYTFQKDWSPPPGTYYVWCNVQEFAALGGWINCYGNPNDTRLLLGFASCGPGSDIPVNTCPGPQACPPSSCGWGGGYLNNGTCGQSWCPATPACCSGNYGNCVNITSCPACGSGATYTRVCYDTGCGTPRTDYPNCGLPDSRTCTASFGACTRSGTQYCSGGNWSSTCNATDPRPANCAGKNCGDDGCSGLCGTCNAPNTCGGGGTANICGCTPKCAGVTCGASNSCGGTCTAGSGCCTGVASNSCTDVAPGCTPACGSGTKTQKCTDTGCGASNYIYKYNVACSNAPLEVNITGRIDGLSAQMSATIRTDSGQESTGRNNYSLTVPVNQTYALTPQTISGWSVTPNRAEGIGVYDCRNVTGPTFEYLVDCDGVPVNCHWGDCVDGSRTQTCDDKACGRRGEMTFTQACNNAGIVQTFATSINAGSGKYSQGGIDPPTLNLTGYASGIDPAAVSYTTLLDNVLRSAGLNYDQLQKQFVTASNYGFTTAGGTSYRFWRVTATETLDSVLQAIQGSGDSAATFHILVPSGDPPQTAATITTARAIGNRKIIVFFAGDLTVSANITTTHTNQSISSIIFILGGTGNLTLAPTVDKLDGIYLFPGDFDDGGGTLALTGYGSLLNLGTNPLGFNRLVGNAASEKWVYQIKYLPLYRSILSRPGLTWSELTPK